jgi:hypothetical protein
MGFAAAALLLALGSRADESWTPATDEARVRRTGTWAAGRHRYAPADALATQEDGAALEIPFRGGGLSVVFDTLTVPSYGRATRSFRRGRRRRSR